MKNRLQLTGERSRIAKVIATLKAFLLADWGITS